MADPRVFFAAERTLLAWVRTGLTVIALGFVVSRFGLFLMLLTASGHGASQASGHHWFSSVLGIILVITGVAVTLGAQHNHTRYVRSLPAEDIPALSVTWLSPFLTFSIAAAGILLAVYLAVV